MSLPPPERVGAVVPAAGRGTRLPGGVAKQFRMLAGIPLLWHTLKRLASEGRIGTIALVVPSLKNPPELPPDLGLPVEVVEGGERRQDSVANGLSSLPGGVDWVVVHDGARPLLPEGMVEACLAGASETGACIAAVPVAETVKRADGDEVVETVSRDGLWLAQTPQVARRDLLERAMDAAKKIDAERTDEAELLEAIGVRVKLVQGLSTNLKVTTPDDLARAELLLASGLMEKVHGTPGEVL